MMRSIRHYWRAYLALMIATVLTTAVLTGSGLVGDAMRHSLTKRALDRLGPVTASMVKPDFFPVEVALHLHQSGLNVAGGIVVDGSVRSAQTSATAGSVRLMGLEPGVFPDLDQMLAEDKGGFIGLAAVNQTLAHELGVVTGSEIIASAAFVDEIAQETLFGERDLDNRLNFMRLRVAGIVADSGWGGFDPQNPGGGGKSLFITLERLQSAIHANGVLNLALLLGGPARDMDRTLLEVIRLEDLGFSQTVIGQQTRIYHKGFLIPPMAEEALSRHASSAALAYLANEISFGDKSVAYAATAAVSYAPNELDPHAPSEWTADGAVVNQWLADALGLQVGDAVEVTYFDPENHDYETKVTSLKIIGVAPMEGLAKDRDLAPPVSGMSDADDMRAWDAPFPLDLRLINREDEVYWDAFGATPKLFVGLNLGQSLWGSRFGKLTSVTLETETELNTRDFDLGAFGFRSSDLHGDAAQVAQGNTDFGQLFTAFSFFLAIASLILTAMFFRLGMEQRTVEIGVFHALGFPRRQLIWRYLGEVLPVVLLGVGSGALVAGWYTQSVIQLMKRYWFVGFDMGFLEPVWTPVTILGGVLITLLLSLATVLVSLVRMLKKTPLALLAGKEVQKNPGGWTRWGWVLVGAGLGLAGYAVSSDTLNPGWFFASGSLVLIGGLMLLGSLLKGHLQRKPIKGWVMLGIRSAGRQRGRFLMASSLVSCAVFILVSVGLNRKTEVIETSSPDSGAGGFTVMATTAQPYIGDISKAIDAAEGVNTRTLGFKVAKGEDASCLNLYQPLQPNLIAPVQLPALHGRFNFNAKMESSVSDPWMLLDKVFEDGAIPAIGDTNTVMWILHSGLGQDLTIQAEDGSEQVLRFVALVGHSLFQSDVIISQTAMNHYFPTRAKQTLFLIESGDPDETIRRLETSFGDYGMDALATSDRLAEFQAIENTYMSIFLSLGGLGLLLGSLGLAVVMYRNVQERRSELAAMQSMGFSHTAIMRTLLVENLMMVVSGLGLGLVSALIAAYPAIQIRGTSGLVVPLATCTSVLFIGLIAGFLAIRNALNFDILAALRGG
ncbi:MAG: ABC transporter permease [Acidobacteria bacterium]|nr:ABC transporter permease [Acidobacteriota bacterium]